jgi:hypothetical protein
MLIGGVTFVSLAGKDRDVGTCYPAADGVGKALMIGGAVLTLAGLVVLPIRLMARSRERDAAHARTSVPTIAPWFSRADLAGLNAGLMGSLNF